MQTTTDRQRDNKGYNVYTYQEQALDFDNLLSKTILTIESSVIDLATNNEYFKKLE